jgi:hypothetical protein
MYPRITICKLTIGDGALTSNPARTCPVQERLEQAFWRLESIEAVRNHRGDPVFGRSAESSIVWRELLDLELQDIDEQIERISATAGG